MEAINNRAISSFFLSVGTSLALESIFQGTLPPIDPDRKIPQQIDYKKYNVIYINIATLFRNLFNAVETSKQLSLKAQDIAEALIGEMDTIKTIISEYTNDSVSVVFYACEYKDATSKTKHPYAYFRTISTEKQKVVQELTQSTIKKILKNDVTKTIKIFDSKILGNPGDKALIITHYAQDLLSSNQFVYLHLLESHTGVLKDKFKFYTKFLNGKDLEMIPFNIAMLQIFGDNEHYRPFPVGSKQKILDVAKLKKWNQLTTKDKIVFDLDNLKDPYLKQVVISMLRESV